ncbi:sensor histidine kinase [Chitinimonas koreensis]|uniref:sensor histidine kinase n=1 Tax=Chitinimonas koreensis TaxID=356302 RepID=UPI0003F60017|nr:histidine kinase [Chitinimonas koreensis]QNM94799.1 histidine kinase [Chitinimonas koreensis]
MQAERPAAAALQPHGRLSRLFLRMDAMSAWMIGSRSQVEQADLDRLDQLAGSPRAWATLAGLGLALALAILAVHMVVLDPVGLPQQAGELAVGLRVGWRWPAPMAWWMAGLVPPVLALAALDVWFGYRKYLGAMGRYFGFSMLFAIFGLVCGFALVAWREGARLNVSALLLAAGIGTLTLALLMLAAVGLTGLFVYLRQREQAGLLARLQADAERERIGRELAESQLKLLQAQIEPHFLFNTLGALQQRAEGKAPEAAALAADLIRFLRGSMDNLRAERTTLADDFRLLAAYLGVMQARMGARLRFELALPEALAARQVPTLMLLTLVENALKHGIEPHPPGGEVRIAAREDGGQLVLEVADTGRGVSDLPGSGTGLDNVRKRLQLHYGAAARLELEENAPQGFLARIRLPLV